MDLKDLLMHYQNDFDTIEEIYCSPRYLKYNAFSRRYFFIVYNYQTIYNIIELIFIHLCNIFFIFHDNNILHIAYIAHNLIEIF